jgi:siroheme synthase-like protein
VSLVVEGRPCLVVGGGPVAARKAAGLAEAGAAVTVVAPHLAPETEALAADVTLVRRAYVAGEAAGYRLVVTATGIAEVDRAVAADAEAAGVWVNSADDAAHCTFLLPSVHRDGPVSVAVSTGGSSPSLAAWLRRRLAEAAGPGLGDLATLLDDVRRSRRARAPQSAPIDWRSVLDGPVPGLVAQGRLDEARALLERAGE